MLITASEYVKILGILRTSPPPQAQAGGMSTNLLSDTSIHTGKTLLPWVRRENLPHSPIQYLTSVIDSLAPLSKIRDQKGVVGGGQSLSIPVPLRVKQRRRTAVHWILDSAENNRDTYLADKIAKEIIKVANGTSSAWEKRAQAHRQAITARSKVRNSLQQRKKFQQCTISGKLYHLTILEILLALPNRDYLLSQPTPRDGHRHS